MNPAFINIILRNQIVNDLYEEENDENPKSNPNNIDIVESIYDEIEKEIETKQIETKQIEISYNQVPIVDEKIFINNYWCFFF
jgi:hypothetical protein